MTDDSNIESAKGILKRAESEGDPGLKVKLFKEGFDSLDDCIANGVTDSQERLIGEIRRTHVRSFLLQLNVFAAVPEETWGDVLLLCAGLRPQIDHLCKTDPKFGVCLDGFLEPRRERILEILREADRSR